MTREDQHRKKHYDFCSKQAAADICKVDGLRPSSRCCRYTPHFRDHSFRGRTSAATRCGARERERERETPCPNARQASRQERERERDVPIRGREREKERVQNSTIQSRQSELPRYEINPQSTQLTQFTSFVRPGSCPVWLGPVLSQCHSASLHPLMHLEH